MATSDIQIYELYDLWYTPIVKQWWFIGLIITICLVIIGALIFWIVRIKKSRHSIKDPWQEALDSLYAIDLKLFEDPEQHRLLYHTLTKILKKYISKRYSLDLEGKTDAECLTILACSSFPHDLQIPLRNILESAITIKFAHQEAILEHMRFDILRSIDIVRNTIPKQS
jgi:hypothetical protein